MSLPNILTLTRIALIPLIFGLLLTNSAVLWWLALVLFAVAAITDFLDGYLSRRYDEISPLGRMLDPIADKMLVAALILVFAANGSFSLWDLVPAMLILMREVFVSGLREFLGSQNVIVHVSALAKYKTTLQLVAFGFVIGERLVSGLSLVSDTLLWSAAILTLITGFEYLRGALPHLNEKNQ